MTHARAYSAAGITALRAYNGDARTIAILTGRDDVGDDGRGHWHWINGVTTGDDGGTIIVPTTNPTGRWERIFDGPVLVTWFGATGLYASDWNSIPAANTTAINAAAAVALAKKRPLHFPMTPEGGVYVHTGLTFSSSFIEVTGDPGVEIVHTGSGIGVSFDGGASGLVQDAGLLFCPRMSNLILRGNANTTVGLYLRSVHQGHFDNIRVEQCSAAALQMWSCTSNSIKNVACTVNRRDFNPKPSIGVWMGRRPLDASDWVCTMNVFDNLIIEGLTSGTGVVFDEAAMNRFIAGTSEGNLNGVQINAASYSNSFDTFTMVGNTGDDIVCAGSYNEFANCQCQETVTFSAGSRANVLRGGTYTGDVTNSSIYSQWYDRPVFSSAVTLTDSVTADADKRIWRSNTATYGAV